MSSVAVKLEEKGISPQALKGGPYAKTDIEKNGADDLTTLAIGITNQRETTICWDKTTARPFHNALGNLPSRPCHVLRQARLTG